jgi:DNA-binding MarR family transcriptional regulator
LVEKGLVERNLCPENRRKMDVLITKEGENMLKQITKKQESLKKEQWCDFTDEEAEQLSNLVDKFRS